MDKKGKMVSGTNGGRVQPIPEHLVGRILDSLDGIVYLADIETNEIIFANRYLQRILGFDPTGSNCQQLFCAGQSGNEFYNSAMLLGSDGTPGEIVHREFQHPFNKKWYASTSQALRWSEDRYVRLEIALDITEHRQLRNFLEEARLQAQTSLNTKNRFVALVAHDLKSPFVSILGMLRRILRKETFQHEVHRRFLENIINNGQRMLKMIDNLLAMDRLETGEIKVEPVNFNLAGMVSEVFEDFAHLAEEKQLLLTNLVPPTAEICADRYLYFVVLNNLISNAVKFSFARGKIEVGYEVCVSGSRLIVRDQGRGIPAKYLKDIFRPDIKTTSKGTSGETGSGLGLVFCQQIINAHGGRITLESIEGEGTTFYVELFSSCRLPISSTSSRRCSSGSA